MGFSEQNTAKPGKSLLIHESTIGEFLLKAIFLTL
jgi:hypothetical protein